MSAEEIILTLVGVFILGAIVVGANYADRYKSRRTRLAVRGVLILINILLVLNGIGQVANAYSPGPGNENPPGKSDAWGALIVSVLVAGLATAILNRRVVERISIIFPRFRGKTKILLDESLVSEPGSSETPSPGEPLFPQMLNYYTTDSLMVPRSSSAMPESNPSVQLDQDDAVRGFNPASMVHVVAVTYVLYFLGVQFIGFILGGGLSGVAESYKDEGLSGWDLILNALPFLVIPVLGVGLGMRRTLLQTLKRLGLEVPTGQAILISFGATIGLFIFVAIVATVWEAVVPKDVYEEQNQASDALANSVTSVGLAFLLAATAAVGEEIAFRGALQPVLGYLPTAIIFAMTHIQYTLTPAWLIILGVALAFGWIRKRYNTTVSILTHFLYNFIPLALTVSVPEETWIWILRTILK